MSIWSIEDLKIKLNAYFDNLRDQKIQEFEEDQKYGESEEFQNFDDAIAGRIPIYNQLSRPKFEDVGVAGRLSVIEQGYPVSTENWDSKNVDAVAGRIPETGQRNILYNMALNDPNRIIDGAQYNALYKAFRSNMPDDEATRSFIAANYVMKDDFNVWSAAQGDAIPAANGDIAAVDVVAGRVSDIRVDADIIRSADGQYTVTAVLPDYNLRNKINSTQSFLDNFQFGDYPPMSDADKEAGYYYSPLIDGITYVRVRQGENGPEIHSDDLMRHQDALSRFNKEAAVSAFLPGIVRVLPGLRNISWLKNKGQSKTGRVAEKVEIIDRRGSPLGEIDGIDLKNSLFIEDKSAKGLNILNPKTGMPQQTPQQWADKQIFGKTQDRINRLQNEAVATRATKDGATDIPNLSEIKNVKKFEFRIDADTPELRQAVNNTVKQLKEKFPDYTFVAKFGGGS